MSAAPQAGAEQKQQDASSNVPVKQETSVPGKTSWVLWRTNFEIDQQYTPIKAIGKGAYGVVCSAKNALTGETVAIKKIGNAFDNLTDARRTLREIKLLRHLRHENIIAVRDIMKATKDRFNDVYLVYELMDTDLHQIIRSSQPLTNEHFQYFVYQVHSISSGRSICASMAHHPHTISAMSVLGAAQLRRHVMFMNESPKLTQQCLAPKSLIAGGFCKQWQQADSHSQGSSLLTCAAAAAWPHTSGAAWAQVRAHSQRAAQGFEAQQPAAQRIV
eukprot:GHRQ01014787.1.p1 GENE.GHRQ01014787.1~~GHRQ01014787.1.p1  ORF type:complete len:274 (+),score=76.38 GHRQ01014787.1:655-1476(+)